MPNARSVSKEKTPAARAVERKAATPNKTKPKSAPFLTGIQERIADIIGELIVTGGTRRNLDALCRIASDHEARRIYGSLSLNAVQLEGSVSDRVADFAPKWFDNLAAARANRPKLPETIRPEPKTVADLIRAATREEVKDYLSGFLAKASPEEIHFMHQVMIDWESEQSTWGDGFESFYIANSFELQIQRNREYVRVPAHLVDDVERYVQALLKANPTKKAA